MNEFDRLRHKALTQGLELVRDKGRYVLKKGRRRLLETTQIGEVRGWVNPGFRRK